MAGLIKNYLKKWVGDMLDYLKSAKIFNDFCAQISKFTRANFKILKAHKF